MNTIDIDSTHKGFACLMKKYYLKFKSSLCLLEPTNEYRNCISTISFSGKYGMVRVLFGAPEWHLEPQFESHGVVWSFADVVCLFPAVGDWLQEHGKNGETDDISELEREVAFFFELLSEMMPRIKEFAWIGTQVQHEETQDQSLTMTHEEVVSKLAKFKEDMRQKTLDEQFRNQILIRANAAWADKDYVTFVALVSSHINCLTKVESAKLSYAQKYINDKSGS